MIALLALAQVQAPLFPPNPRDHQIIDRIYYHQIPDPSANKLRLCQGRVCFNYHERKGAGLTVTLPFGKHRKP